MVGIERYGNKLSLILTSERGTLVTQTDKYDCGRRYFETTHIIKV
ncbi:hypothetical protein [Bartonella schoenbuchensis]